MRVKRQQVVEVLTGSPVPMRWPRQAEAIADSSRFAARPTVASRPARAEGNRTAPGATAHP
jgi:hypothetical protein